MTSMSFATFADLVALEPDLAALEADVLTAEPVALCDFWEHWDAVKQRLAALAGFAGRVKALATSDAYEIAYGHLFDLFGLRSMGRGEKGTAP